MLGAGCSVNDLGWVDQSEIDIGAAVVRVAVARGVHLDTRFASVSVSVGRYQAAWVLADACGNKDQLQLMYRRVHGVEVIAGRDEVGVTLGYRERLLAAGFGDGPGLPRRIAFDPDNPDATRFEALSDITCADEDN